MISGPGEIDFGRIFNTCIGELKFSQRGDLVNNIFSRQYCLEFSHPYGSINSGLYHCYLAVYHSLQAILAALDAVAALFPASFSTSVIIVHVLLVILAICL